MTSAFPLPSHLAAMWLFPIILVCWALPLFVEAEVDSSDSLDAELREALASLSADQRRLDAHYREALLDLLSREEVAVDRARKELVESELRDFRMGVARDYRDFPTLQKLRSFYEEASAEKEEPLLRSREAILKIYEDRYRMLQESLEASGDIAASVQARLRREEIAAALEDPGNLGSLLALWKFRTPRDGQLIKDLELERKEGRYLLSSTAKSGSRLSSNVAVRTPFEIDTVIATDSTNIRYYLDGRVVAILNWEVKPTELRIHDPRGGIKPFAIPEQGYVEVNQLHRIQVQIHLDRVRVYVDGEFRGEILGEYEEVRGKPSVGPAFGSVLTLERFEVLPLEE